jgi:hypothetical protein
LLQSIANSTDKRTYFIIIAILGAVMFRTVPVQSMAQSGPRVNWYEIFKKAIVDSLITEPCNTLTTNGGYTLTPEGERVLACLGGGALALAAPELAPALKGLKTVSNCGTSSSSSSSNSFLNTYSNKHSEEPLTNILDSLLG